MTLWIKITGCVCTFAIALALAAPAAAEQINAITVQEVQPVPGQMSYYNHAAWWSPIAHHDGSVYASYLAANSPMDDVHVVRRAPDGTLTTADTGFKAKYDRGHTQASIGIDGKGHLHVSFGLHNTPMQIALSNQPRSIDDGFTLQSSPAFERGGYTYQILATAPNGDLYMIAREVKRRPDNRIGMLYRFDNARRQWKELTAFAGQPGTTIYPDGVLVDGRGDVHIIWEWAAGTAQGTRHYGSYVRYRPSSNTFYRADGTRYRSGPIRLNDADIYQPLEGNETFARGVPGIQSAKLTLDDQNRPIVAYSYSIDQTNEGYEHRLARWTGKQWQRQTVTPGPFAGEKPWLTHSDGTLRYYGPLSSKDPRHTGTADLFVRVSSDLGQTWSEPIQVTSGLSVERPMGVTADGADYLYLPDPAQQRLYLGIVKVK